MAPRPKARNGSVKLHLVIPKSFNDAQQVADKFIPMFIRRFTVLGASLVCSVDSTRWPVSAALTAISAVSKSRISPTRMMLGSWRRNERSAAAKFRPMLSLTCTWLTPARLNSTGSSAVMMLVSGVLIFAIDE